MDWRNLAKRIDGIHSVESLSSEIGIKKSTAIYYIHELRKRELVKTSRGRKGKRLYNISPLHLKDVGSDDFLEILDKNTRMGVRGKIPERVYGKELTLEDVLILAIKSENTRLVLASIELFRKRLDWKRLFKLSKEEGLERIVGALYVLSRRYLRVRRMDKRIFNSLKKSPVKKKYIIRRVRTRDFLDIKKEWGIEIPFRFSDMEKLR